MTVKKKENEEEKDISKDQCEKEPQFNSKSEKSPSQHQDPLKWFGILVPQNLKQTQAAFKEGKCKTQVYTTIVACKCMSAFLMKTICLNLVFNWLFFLFVRHYRHVFENLRWLL